MRRGVLVGVVATLVAEAVVAAVVVVSGVVDVAATSAGGLPDRILAYASTRSIARHASDAQNPRANDPAAPKAGLQQYQAMCLQCHGAPGAAPEEFAAGLHPAAPDLASREIQAFTDGMLYRTIANGIGSTGMPAFGPTHTADELWALVAFVRRLPSLSAEEKKALAGAAAHEEDHGAAAAAPAAGRVHQVAMTSLKFAPADLRVHAGDTVEWKNEDFVAHTATADDKSFDTGRIDAGETKRVVVRKKGKFPYFCRYHVAMRATLTVE